MTTEGGIAPSVILVRFSSEIPFSPEPEFFRILINVTAIQMVRIINFRSQKVTDRQASSRDIYQLRIYEVSADKRAIFHTRFRNHALRIMQRYGFEILALWESTSVVNFEFVYLLRWPDAETMDRRWKAFLADEEWIGIKKDTVRETGEPVIRVTSRLLDNTDYSPAFDPA